MSVPFMTQISLFGCTYPPRDWAWCQGQLMDVNDYTAIFALVGTLYGGDGRSTFGVPNLIGRVPIGNGSAPGITTKYIGDLGGEEYVTLNIYTMPSHSHGASASVTSQGALGGSPTASATVKCNNSTSSTGAPSGKVWGKLSSRDNIYADNIESGSVMNSDAVSINVDLSDVDVVVQSAADVAINNTGGGQSHKNLPPYQVIPYSFSLDGVFPPRN